MATPQSAFIPQPEHYDLLNLIATIQARLNPSTTGTSEDKPRRPATLLPDSITYLVAKTKSNHALCTADLGALGVVAHDYGLTPRQFLIHHHYETLNLLDLLERADASLSAGNHLMLLSELRTAIDVCLEDDFLETTSTVHRLDALMIASSLPRKFIQEWRAQVTVRTGVVFTRGTGRRVQLKPTKQSRILTAERPAN